MAREKEYPVRITLPLEQSMADAVDAAREPEEPRVDLIRKGIARELKARGKPPAKPRPSRRPPPD